MNPFFRNTKGHTPGVFQHHREYVYQSCRTHRCNYHEKMKGLQEGDTKIVVSDLVCNQRRRNREGMRTQWHMLGQCVWHTIKSIGSTVSFNKRCLPRQFTGTAVIWIWPRNCSPAPQSVNTFTERYCTDSDLWSRTQRQVWKQHWVIIWLQRDNKCWDFF